MNLKINTNISGNNYQVHNSITFNGLSRKTIRNAGYVLMAASMLASYSCLNNKPKFDTIELTETKTNDKFDKDTDSIKKQENVKNIYHYFPKKDNIITNEPDWTEKIYPDGRIEIDSLGYKISVSPDGQRTVTKTEKDSIGNTIITTDFPDSTKTVKTYYLTQDPSEIFHIEKTYRSNGKLKESLIYKEHRADSTDTISPKIEQQYKMYNENEVLIYWNCDSLQSENNSNSVYDNNNRLIYDNIKNEKFYYKGTEKTPYKSISQIDDCKRITLYNDSGMVKKIYFEASDGTITEK